MKLEITDKPLEKDNEYIAEQTREYNRQFIKSKYQPLSVFIRNDSEEIIGGLTSKIYWNWLHIDFLWVSEVERGSNLGTKIMDSAETEAVKAGCIGSTLDTFSFQALQFYQKRGYKVLGTIEGYEGNHKRFYLSKTLNKAKKAGTS